MLLPGDDDEHPLLLLHGRRNPSNPECAPRKTGPTDFSADPVPFTLGFRSILAGASLILSA